MVLLEELQGMTDRAQKEAKVKEKKFYLFIKENEKEVGKKIEELVQKIVKKCKVAAKKGESEITINPVKKFLEKYHTGNEDKIAINNLFLKRHPDSETDRYEYKASWVGEKVHKSLGEKGLKVEFKLSDGCYPIQLIISWNKEKR